MEHLIKQCLPTYDIVEKIGEGVYGSIYHIRDPYKERAVKIVPVTAERTRDTPGSVELDSKISRDFHAVKDYYESIKGEGVVEIHDFFLIDKQVSDKQAKAHLLILMQYCPANLQDQVIDAYPLEPETAITYMRDLAKILERLFRLSGETFLVTDLKPSNLLLDANGRLVVGDLGGLKRISTASTTVGVQFSPSWCSPEIVLQGASPNIASTIYAYGLVGYYIWEGNLPYEDNDFVNRFQKMKKGGILLQHSGIPATIYRLIQQCLSFEPDKRPSGFDEILKILDNPAPEHTVLRKPSSPVLQFPAEKQRLRSKTGPQAQVESQQGMVSQVRAGSNTAGLVDELKSSRSGVLNSKNNKPSQQQPVSTNRPVKIRKAPPSSTTTWVEPGSGIAFILVRGGEFTMGALPEDPQASREEKPGKDVQIEPFWIGKYPVTQDEWRRVMGQPCSHFSEDGRLPVEQVSWREAVSFVERLTAGSAKRFVFSLPSEAQWEFAARSGGRDEIFPGDLTPDECAWYKDNSGFSTHPVGEKAPNGIGLFDMSGNIMEWCSDVYIEDAYRRQHLQNVNSSDSGVKRVCRGGSWRQGAEACRTTARRGLPQGLKYTDLGFRVVRIQ